MIRDQGWAKTYGDAKQRLDQAEDLEKKEEGETVGFVPLFWQQPNGDRVQGLSCFCVAYIEVPDSHVELTTDVN